jgi:hypothetical protein
MGHGITAPPPVIAQQYSSATYISLRTNYRKKKTRHAF